MKALNALLAFCLGFIFFMAVTHLFNQLSNMPYCPNNIIDRVLFSIYCGTGWAGITVREDKRKKTEGAEISTAGGRR